MDKTILQQYIDACELLKETREDLEQLKRDSKRITTDSVKGSNPEFPYQAMSFKVSGIEFKVYNNPEQIRKTEALLEERKVALADLKIRLEAFINVVPPRIGRIIRLKYIKGKTWEQVSSYLGYSSPSAARMALERYFETKC